MAFGNLTVTSYSRKERRKNWRGYFHYWTCICACGNETEVLHEHLLSGHTKSCGCYKVEKVIQRSTKHGGAGTRLYNMWIRLKERCYNSRNQDYKYYGARGIRVCDEWRNDFEAFQDWAMKNGYNDELTIERIDVNGNYTPDNCRFATMKEQNRNKRNNIVVSLNGKERLFIEICDKFGLDPIKARQRYYQGKTMEEIIQQDDLKVVL